MSWRSCSPLLSLQGPYRVRVLWLTADPAVLYARLDARVDGMMARGLLREVEDLNRLLLSAGYHTGTPDAAATGGGATASASGHDDVPADVDDSSSVEDPESVSPRDGDPEAVAHGIQGLDQRPEGAAGLLIAIGYKEFAAYFDACRAGDSSLALQASLLEECVVSLKQVTRRWV